MGNILLGLGMPLVFGLLLVYLAPRILRRHKASGRRPTPP